MNTRGYKTVFVFSITAFVFISVFLLYSAIDYANFSDQYGKSNCTVTFCNVTGLTDIIGVKFEVDGENFTATMRVTFDYAENATEFCEDHPPNSTLQCYYRIDDPANSLSTQEYLGDEARIIILVAVLTFFDLACLYFMIYAILHIRKCDYYSPGLSTTAAYGYQAINE